MFFPAEFTSTFISGASFLTLIVWVINFLSGRRLLLSAVLTDVGGGHHLGKGAGGAVRERDV